MGDSEKFAKSSGPNKISNANLLKKTNCKNITTEIKERLIDG